MAGCRDFSDEEIELIKSRFNIQRDKLLFVLAVRTGLRISELLSIRIGDVYKFNRITDRVKLTKNQTKGKNESCEIMLHKEAVQEIDTYLKSLENVLPDQFLFKSRVGSNKALGRTQAHYILKGAIEGLNLIGKIAWHSCRKTLAWRFYTKSGHNLRSLQKALRHSSILTTVKYLDPEQKEVDRLILEL